MSITRVDISEEIQDWRDAVYGEDVRSANISALTKLQTQMNEACDGIETVEADATDTLALARSASSTANAAAADAQTAISQAQGAITTAQGYAEAAGASATEAAGKVSECSAYANDAQGYRNEALTAKTAAERARDEAREAIPEDYEEVLKIVSNDNLLDNPFFTVNQRGVTTWTSGYGVDRWRTNGSNVTCTISNGLLSFTTASTYAGIAQFLESERLVIGKQYTASVMLSDGTIKSGTFTASTSGTISISSIDSTWLLRILYESSLWKLSIINTSGVNASLSVKAIKLEKGTTSTLANDSAPDYATELLKCQRYFVRFSGASANYYVGCGMCNTSTEFVVHIPYPTRMRAVPAASLMAASKYSVFIANGYAKTATAVNQLLRGVDFATLVFTTSGLTAGQAANLGFSTAGTYIDFSADL